MICMGKFLSFPVTFYIWIVLSNFFLGTTGGSVLLYSFFSWGGLRGNATFSWDGPGTRVVLSVSVDVARAELEPSPEEYDWGIYDNPVRYDTNLRCRAGDIGSRIVDLSSLFGKLTVPGSHTFESQNISVVGKDSVWSQTLRIYGTKTTCANIQGEGGEEVHEARFFSPYAGSVWFRSWSWSLSGQAGTQTTITTHLFNVYDDQPASSRHNWTLFITDILDTQKDRSTCDFLSLVYDPSGVYSCEGDRCPQGMLTNIHGQVPIGARSSVRSSRKSYRTSNLTLPEGDRHRQVYLGIMDRTFPDRIAACARVARIKARMAKAVFSSKGVRGSMRMMQASPFAPTELTLSLMGLAGSAGAFHVHSLPTGPQQTPGENTCGSMAGHHNPYKVEVASSPPPGYGSHSQYEVGDLSGKHGTLNTLEEIDSTVVDHNLPLFGADSVIGRGIVVHTDSGSRWVCANVRNSRKVVRAAVTFRYPLVGEIIFEQEEEDPLSDTTIHVGPLVYSDGSHNSTNEHEWFVHEDIPGKDFYNWTARCMSAGGRYNPHMVSVSDRVYGDCGAKSPLRCLLGDLSARHGELRVSGTVRGASGTRMVFTDTNLPLGGAQTIMGHSIVIQDKHAPAHRGDRMACSGIYRRFRHKGVVNKWHSSDDYGQLKGKLEFIQESEYDLTTTEVELEGLAGVADGYHIHMVPVELELEFPCDGLTLGGHYNPLKVSPPESPPPGRGTDDQYELGDLSGKYGSLEGLSSIRDVYNDTNLPLFGSTSVMGRSVIIHKKKSAKRWFCGSIQWGYAPSEARQVSAIASFHNPQGYAWGYVRMRQLVYEDGRFGETFLEVKLRHPGSNNKNVTSGHNWSIYVNPVGVDAAVKFLQTRCVAAGFRWNPFLIQLAHPNDKDFYDKQCTPEFPLRCDVGDLSGRLGPLTLGKERAVFVDPNIPLVGEHSVMGKSVVIHGERGGVDRFACGNIEPDHDILKWVNIRKSPIFSPTIFMEDMRDMLGAPEWFMAINVQSVSYSADGKCATFQIHFMGPLAHELEQDFARLIAGGLLERPTVEVPGALPDPKRKKKVPYRSCGTSDEEELRKTHYSNTWFGSAAPPGAASSPFLTLTLVPLGLFSTVN